MSVLICAEPGSTHEGDYDTMLRLIKAAASAGVDCVKNQWVSCAETMCDRRHAPEYRESYRKIQYQLDWHAHLREVCREYGLQYACTAYLPDDATALAPFVDYIKLSSFEVGDDALLTAALKTGRRVIVSTGMCADYDAILPTLSHPTMPWAVLHCCSSYVAPLGGLNLRAIKRGLAPALNGYSDHSRDIRVGAWAVAAGAEVIETHFRLDECDPANKDYDVSFTPVELERYVRNIRDVEIALGTGVKSIQPCEENMAKFKVHG